MATYYDLVIRCPACLANNEEPGPASQWFHAKPFCSGKIQIGDDAQFKCTSCAESFQIRTARYKCSKHTDYRQTTSAHFASAVSTSGQVASIAGSKWLIKLLQNMGDDW